MVALKNFISFKISLLSADLPFNYKGHRNYINKRILTASIFIVLFLYLKAIDFIEDYGSINEIFYFYQNYKTLAQLRENNGNVVFYK